MTDSRQLAKRMRDDGSIAGVYAEAIIDGSFFALGEDGTLRGCVVAS